MSERITRRQVLRLGSKLGGTFFAASLGLTPETNNLTTDWEDIPQLSCRGLEYFVFNNATSTFPIQINSQNLAEAARRFAIPLESPRLLTVSVYEDIPKEETDSRLNIVRWSESVSEIIINSGEYLHLAKLFNPEGPNSQEDEDFLSQALGVDILKGIARVGFWKGLISEKDWITRVAAYERYLNLFPQEPYIFAKMIVVNKPSGAYA